MYGLRRLAAARMSSIETAVPSIFEEFTRAV
jgi:hypothetical protein